MKTHRSTALRLGQFCTLVLLAVIATGIGLAQVATPPAAATAAKEEVVSLSPFEIVSDASDTYEATNTAALTGMSMSLNKAPLDARILNNTLITELGGGDMFKLLADYAGLGTMIFGGGEGLRGLQDGDQAQPAGLSARGFGISEPRRDGFLRSATSLFNGFDVESAETVNGSNNLLYGSGGVGGLVVINTKRARMQQRSFKFSHVMDSEGSHRFTTDMNVGTKRFGVRVNGLKSRDRYYRPILGLEEEAVQGAVTFRPYRWINIFADYRHYTRAAVHSADGTINAPTNLLLTTGERLNGQSLRYLVGLGGTELTNGKFDLTTMDSAFGVLRQQHFINASKSITIDMTPHRDLVFQFRYAHDNRVNNLTNATGTVYHPDSTSNRYANPDGTLKHEWALLSGLNPGLWGTGGRGYKFTAVGHRNLGRWGEHTFSGYYHYTEAWSNRQDMRYYEMDSSGKVIQNMANFTNADAGRNAFAGEWMPAFPESMFGGLRHPSNLLVASNGKRYSLQPIAYADGVARTAANPMGLTGTTDARGVPTTTIYTLDDYAEESVGFTLSSSFWKGRIDTLAGFRFETGDSLRVTTGAAGGPSDYNSRTLGLVFDTPLQGVRGYISHSINSSPNYTPGRDIFNNILPNGRGETLEGGLKLSVWEGRLSGNLTYYKTEAQNFAGALGAMREDVDPDGINGRNGGPSFIYDKISDGLSASLSARPFRPWTITMSFTQADGIERSDVTVPILYNDEFNTMTVGGQSVVAIKSGSGGLTPLLVASTPANPASAQVPLSVAMMRDPNSPYFAQLDPDSGQILNSLFLGLRTTGVGTTRTGLPISNHQLGFTPPNSAIIVRKAGEVTTGYAENQFSMINRYQVQEGRFRGLVLGMGTVYRRGFRAYMYTDAADANNRKIYYFPDKVDTNGFVNYPFRPTKTMRATVSLNVFNVLDRQQVIVLPRATNGTVRFFQHYYTPRKIQLTTALSF
jgi:hypothetical protein